MRCYTSIRRDQEKLLDTAAGGLLNLSMELGFEVMRQMLELDVETLAGKKGKHNPKRIAYRHGSEATKVVLGGEKRSVDKPRVRSISGSELPLSSLAQFQDEDLLSQLVLAKLLRGVSTRKYAGTTEHPSPDSSACTSKSGVPLSNRRQLPARRNKIFASAHLSPQQATEYYGGLAGP